MNGGRHLEVVRDFFSPEEGVARTLRVLLPPLGAPPPFGVLLLQDGQNLFDEDSDLPLAWGVDAAFATLDRRGLASWLVVAVDHRGVDRVADYSPFADHRFAEEPRGDRYASFLVETLLPWIEGTFPVSADPRRTAIGGSSLGGLVALYTVWKYRSRIGRVAALSPSVMWGDRELFDAYDAHPPTIARVYLDVGARERFDAGAFTLDYGSEVTSFAGLLRARSGGEGIRFVRDRAGAHDERSWRRRLPSALDWLLRD